MPIDAGVPCCPATTTVPSARLTSPGVIETMPDSTGPLTEYGAGPPMDTATVSAGSTPAKAVPVSWARVGQGGPAGGADGEFCQAPAPPLAAGLYHITLVAPLRAQSWMVTLVNALTSERATSNAVHRPPGRCGGRHGRGRHQRRHRRRLGISHRTVDKHLQGAFDRLGVVNRTAAANLIRQLEAGTGEAIPQP